MLPGWVWGFFIVLLECAEGKAVIGGLFVRPQVNRNRNELAPNIQWQIKNKTSIVPAKNRYCVLLPTAPSNK